MDRAQWVPEYDVLIVNGTMFSLAQPDHRTSCDFPVEGQDDTRGTDRATRE